MDNCYKILISCYSGEKDAGDETMLLCIREQLESLCNKRLSFKAFSNNPDISDEFNENVEFIYSGRHGLKQPGRRGFAAFRWIGQMISALWDCDILITGGGTILYDESNRFFVPFWFLKIMIAQLFHKPTVFYGIGVGPLNRKSSRFLMNTLGKRMNFISLRGVESQKWMQRFRVPQEKVFLTADPAVTIYPAKPSAIDDYLRSEDIRLHPDRELVVIVIREWFLRKNRGLEQAQDKTARISSYDDYVSQLAAFCKYIVETDHSDIIFMPMGSLPPCDDRLVMSDIYQKMKQQHVDLSGVFQMSDITDSRIMTGIMGRAKAVITGRFHGLVYATTQYVPALGIAYTEKYYDYYNYIGLSDYIIGMNDLTGSFLIQKYEEMLSHRADIIKLLKAEIPKQIENAAENARMVCEILNSKGN